MKKMNIIFHDREWIIFVFSVNYNQYHYYDIIIQNISTQLYNQAKMDQVGTHFLDTVKHS